MEMIRMKKTPDVTELSGEKVMIDFESGKYYLLKGAANDIWELIQQEATADEVVRGLMARYEVEQAECERAVADFLAKLKELDFID